MAAGFDAAAHVIAEDFNSNRVTAVPIEPRGCLAVPEQPANLVFYSSTQIHHLLRTALAEFLDVAESTLRVVVPDVGGGFGIKAALYPEEFVCAALALRLRRPVKWIQDRYGALLTDVHARDNHYRVEAAVDDDGIVLALRAEIRTNGGAYSALPFGCTLETTGGARMIVGPYRITEYEYTATAVATHTAPVLAYRGVAQPVCFMAIEGIMDRIARRLELDPAEVRLRNMVPTAELPWTNIVGVRYDTGSFVESLELAMEMANYDEFRASQSAWPTRRRQVPGHRHLQLHRGERHGRPGLACPRADPAARLRQRHGEGGAHGQSDRLREPRPTQGKATSRPSRRSSPTRSGPGWKT